MDQSPIQIVEMTPLDRVIEMFKALGLRHLMVTRHGALVLLLSFMLLLRLFCSHLTFPPSCDKRTASHCNPPTPPLPPSVQVGIIKKKDILEHIQIFHRRDLERSGAGGYDEI